MKGQGGLVSRSTLAALVQDCVGIFEKPNIRTRLLNPNIFGYSDGPPNMGWVQESIERHSITKNSDYIYCISLMGVI